MSNTEALDELRELHDYYTRMSYAYRKSYKLLSTIHKIITISIAISSSGALIALFPLVPIGVVLIAPTIPAILAICSHTLKLPKKVERMKLQYQNCKELLIFIQMNAYSDNPKDIIKEVYLKYIEIQKHPFYCTALERFLAKYHLNGYAKKNNSMSITDNTEGPNDPIVLQHFARYSFKK